MKYCIKCGKELDDNAVFCAHCGANQNAETAPAVQPQATYQQPEAPADASSFGFAFLGFCIPLVGLILWLVWKDKTPLKAKSAGKGALIGVIVSAICYIIYFVFLGVLMATSY